MGHGAGGAPGRRGGPVAVSQIGGLAQGRDVSAPDARLCVAIVERLPAYRHGLALGFAEHGFEVDELAALDDTITTADGVAVTVDGQADWRTLAALAETPDRPVVVALLEDASVAHYRRALRLGLEGAVPRAAPIEEIVGAVEAALTGTILLSSQIARQLADGTEADERLPISDSEIGWLRSMAEGVTIAEMAHGARYSQRQMHRMIANLYKRIGAANRQQALVLATRYGILDD